MANSNDFVPFATGGSATVLSQAAWLALAARATGFQQGVADENACNKAWRQASIVAAMIAQFTADFGPGNVVDDGNIANLEAQFEAALDSYLDVRYQRMLPSSTIFYINNASGNDSTGNGSSGSPWATIAHALSVVQGYNLGGSTLTIQLANTGVAYPTPANIPLPSGGSLIIQGNALAQASYTITGTPGANSGVITVTNGSLHVIGLTIQNVAGDVRSSGVLAGYGGQISLTNVTLAATTSTSFSLLWATAGGTLTVNSGCVMAGSAQIMWVAQSGGEITQNGGVATSGTPAFSSTVVSVTTLGNITVVTGNWSGSGATGARYVVQLNGAINTGGGGPNFFPGSTAGSTATGGQYV